MERLEALNAYTSNDISRENESQKTAREAVVAKKTLFDNAEKLIAAVRITSVSNFDQLRLSTGISLPKIFVMNTLATTYKGLLIRYR